MDKSKRVAVSWSGGKDACLALYKVLKQGYDVVCLVSMVSLKDSRNHAHGVPLEVLKMQANALGFSLILVDSRGDYEKSFVESLCHLKEEFGVEAIAFGSLYAKEDRLWNEEVARESGLDALFPVWTIQKEAGQLFDEFCSLGFKAVICRASEKYFDQSYPGRLLDMSFYDELLKKNICVMGEMGEYHTFVIDGPIFYQPLNIKESEVVINSGLWSLDIRKCE